MTNQSQYGLSSLLLILLDPGQLLSALRWRRMSHLSFPSYIWVLRFFLLHDYIYCSDHWTTHEGSVPCVKRDSSPLYICHGGFYIGLQAWFPSCALILQRSLLSSNFFKFSLQIPAVKTLLLHCALWVVSGTTSLLISMPLRIYLAASESNTALKNAKKTRG